MRLRYSLLPGEAIFDMSMKRAIPRLIACLIPPTEVPDDQDEPLRRIVPPAHIKVEMAMNGLD
jgi:hypothetical protein